MSKGTRGSGTPSPVVSTRFPSSQSPQAAVPAPGMHASQPAPHRTPCPAPLGTTSTQAVPQAWLSLDPTWGRPCRQGLRKVWQGGCFSASHSQPVRKRCRECEVLFGLVFVMGNTESLGKGGLSFVLILGHSH